MTDSYLYLLVKAIVTLVFVLGLLSLAMFALRRYMRGSSRVSAGGEENPVRVLNTTFLGQKKNLAVVEVAGEMLVLGVTPTSITFLSKVDRPEAVEELKKLNGRRVRPLLNLFQ